MCVCVCVCVFIMGGKEQKGKVRIFEAPYSLLQKHLIKVGYYIVLHSRKYSFFISVNIVHIFSPTERQMLYTQPPYECGFIILKL